MINEINNLFISLVDTYSELDEIYKFVEQNNIKQWFVFSLLPSGRGAENYNEPIFAAGLKYADAIKDRTYRVICTHYADVDGYEEVVNDTGAFKFTY